MDFNINIDGRDYSISSDNNGVMEKVKVGEKAFEVRIIPLPDKRNLALVDNQVIEWSETETTDEQLVVSDGSKRKVQLEDPRRLKKGSMSSSSADCRAEIRAPMPGKVVKILVSEGDEIESGAGIVILEAMKMENEMRSPTKGTVTSINFEAGNIVEAGAVIAVIEPSISDN